MKTFKIIKSSARIVTNAGLTLVGKMLDAIKFQQKCNQLPTATAHPENQISEGDVFISAIGNMCAGTTSFESVKEYRADSSFYEDALGVSRFPSPERLRQRLDQTAQEESGNSSSPVHDFLRQMNVALLKQNNVKITPLPNGDVPVDADVTPYDESKSHKEGVSRTYKGFDGYAPFDVHIGMEGYFINTMFREGKTHSQNGTAKVLIETIDICRQLTGRTLLFRLDSGNDSAENIGVIMERGHHFIIKRNPRKESKEAWLALAEAFAPIHEKPRDGKDIYIGSTWMPVSYVGMDGEPKTSTVRIVFEITKRTIDKYGQILLIPEIELNTWWDNTGLPDREVIELYHQHGTMEQYHSELKTDMSMERLPSGKFATNKLYHELSMVAYNILRLLGDLLCDIPMHVPMRNKACRRRFRTVITHIIHAPAKIVTGHARCFTMDLGRSNAWADAFMCLSYMI